MSKRNILFIECDSMDGRAMGCVGHPAVKTPHLDHLAERGALFRNTYCSSPQCCPSRASRVRSLEDYCTDACWKDGTFPFLIKVAGQLAGFAVVKRTNGASEQATNVMLHFFVLRKYRHRGIGTRAANQLFHKFSGKWGIGYIEDNEPARLFWENVVR